MPNTSSCLTTVVKNTSGVVLTVACWPPHGRTFAIGESVTLQGDLMSYLVSKGRPTRVISTIQGLLTTGKLAIVSTPAPIMYDSVLDRTSMLTVNNGALYAKDPCWASTAYSSPL